MKTDTLFYKLFQHHPELALELLKLDYSGDSYRFSSEEIKQTAFRIDGVFTPLDDDPQQPLIFAEFQAQAEDDFYDRLFSEISLYLRIKKPNHKWLILVIYPTRKLERPASIAFKPFMNLPQLHRIYLEDYKNRTGLSSSLELLSLIACTKGQTMARAREIIENQDKISDEMLDLIETILVYKLPKLSREEIKSMLGLDDVKLKETRFYQEAWGEGREEGLERGVKKGREEEGKILLKRMLTNRFGELPTKAQQKLEQASLEQIELWADHIFNAPSLDALFKTTIH